MSRYGSPYGAGYGSPDNCITYLEAIPKRGNTSIAVRFIPRTNWGNAYWGVYRNARLFKNVYATEGVITPVINVPNDPGSTLTSIILLRLGHISDQNFDISTVAKEYDSLTSPRVTLNWQWTPECIGSPNAAGGTSAWSLTGITRQMTRVNMQRPTWTMLDWSVSLNGSVYTVTLFNGNSLPVASGSGNAGVINLTQLNGSGVSGSVTIAAAATTIYTNIVSVSWTSGVATLTIGAHLLTVGQQIQVAGVGITGYNVLATITGVTGTTVSYALPTNPGTTGLPFGGTVTKITTDSVVDFRWFSSMKIKRDTIDPPTPVIATVPTIFDDFAAWTEPANLTPGTYYYRTAPYTDSDETGPDSASLVAIVPGPPVAPLSLARLSGNAANLILSFTNSTTPAATYSLYLEQIGAGFMNMNDIAATAIAGAGQITCPAITGYPGTAYAVVRAVNAGVEDKNKFMLPLEFDASGVYIPARPNTPSIQENSVVFTTGVNLAVTGKYNSAGQKAAATTLQLFTRTPTGSYNFASPAATATLNPTSDTFSAANLTATLAGTGYYYITLMAVTAGGVQSAVNATELLIYASTATPTNTAATLTVDRG